jgi:hypothetical protein
LKSKTNSGRAKISIFQTTLRSHIGSAFFFSISCVEVSGGESVN